MKIWENEFVYVVTGASYGIGHAVAVNLAKKGLPTLAVARSAELLQRLADSHPEIQPVSADVSTSTGLESVLSAIPQDSEIRGFVHCAGSLIDPQPFGEMDTEALLGHFLVHVAAKIQLIQMLSRKAKLARVLTIDSYSASEPRDGWGAYSIVKAAAQMAARCASQELATTRMIRVFPGAVQTGVVDAVIASDAKASQVYAAMKADGKVALPNDVAEFIAAILIDSTDQLLESVPAWDYNNQEHHELLKRSSVS